MMQIKQTTSMQSYLIEIGETTIAEPENYALANLVWSATLSLNGIVGADMIFGY